MKKVNIGIDKETHKRAKIISVLKDIKLNDYLKSAIESAVQKDRAIIRMVK